MSSFSFNLGPHERKIFYDNQDFMSMGADYLPASPTGTVVARMCCERGFETPNECVELRGVESTAGATTWGAGEDAPNLPSCQMRPSKMCPNHACGAAQAPPCLLYTSPGPRNEP